MKAAVLTTPAKIDSCPLSVEDLPIPQPGPGQVLLKVRACGVCRTDLHIVEGELPPLLSEVTPGHQIVGEIVEAHHPRFRQGARFGVSWIGGTDGSCSYCNSQRENLCDNPTFTGYSCNGGYAQYAIAREDFLLALPEHIADEVAAPLLCAGIIGFRSLRVAEIQPGQKVGLFGFGSSAQLAIQVLKGWGCDVYVSTRGERHRQTATEMGAKWVGSETDVPPAHLDAAVTFAPSGDVVIAALKSLRKGGIVAINAIHLDRIPEFDYDSLLWGERQIRSVANMTRDDGRTFLEQVSKFGIKPVARTYPLSLVNQALQAVKHDTAENSVVILPWA
jgi:alcohol dehydrogenase, propanol-preferring